MNGLIHLPLAPLRTRPVAAGSELPGCFVVGFTVPANVRSRALMQRLGFRYDAHGDFEHPPLPAGHALRPHLLYRLRSGAWRAARPGETGGG